MVQKIDLIYWHHNYTGEPPLAAVQTFLESTDKKLFFFYFRIITLPILSSFSSYIKNLYFFIYFNDL